MSEIEIKYRKALECAKWQLLNTPSTGEQHRRTLDLIYEALSSSPAPEPVTVGEVERELDIAWDTWAEEDSEGLADIDSVIPTLANHLLTNFNITRKP